MKHEDPIDFRYNFRMYGQLLKPYTRLGVGLLFVILVVEALVTLDKFLFKEVIDKGTAFADGSLASAGFLHVLLIVGIIFGSALILRSVLKWVYLDMVNRLDAGIILDLKQKLFNHIIGLSHNFHTTHKTGSLISRLVRGANAVERMTDVVVFNVVPLLFQLVVVSASLIYFDWATALVAFLSVAAFVVYSLLIQVRQQQSKIDFNDVEDFEKGKISDFFLNVDSIKYFGKERMIRQKYGQLGENTKRAMMRFWDYFRWMDMGQAFILGVGTFFMVYFPLKGLLAGSVTIGTVVFIYTVYMSLLGPVYSFVHGMRGFYQAMGDFETLFTYARIQNDIKDKHDAKQLEVRKGGISFSNVTFGYTDRKLLENFSLDIRPNTRVALVGHSGSGKSTLVKLLYRLYDVQEGSISIDGVDVRDVAQESLRSSLSIVPQECLLFDDTIYNNVAFARPSATKAEVLAAMQAAQLDRIVQFFPKAEQTIVGERGVKLSGGEKQRVSIARALLADKKVLVLDEATSSLDSQTEHDIQDALHTLMEGRTSIIIAHRLSTIMHADVIVVMEYGSIVQMGTHQELISQPGVYSTLWNLQKGGYLPKSPS